MGACMCFLGRPPTGFQQYQAVLEQSTVPAAPLAAENPSFPRTTPPPQGFPVAMRQKAPPAHVAAALASAPTLV